MSAIFKGQEIQEENIFKDADEHCVRVRQFQPAQAAQITGLCDESLRIFRLKTAFLFFTYTLMFLVCFVFSV